MGFKQFCQICGGIKFRSEGYTSLNVLGITVVMCTTFFFLIFISYFNLVLEKFFKDMLRKTIEMWKANSNSELLRKAEYLAAEPEGTSHEQFDTK